MQHPASKDIQKIVSACLQGDRLAQKRLYQQLYGKLLAVTMRYANNTEDAKVILNSAFVKIFNDLNKYDNQRAFIPWARQITVHTAIDEIRKRANYKKHQQLFQAQADAQPFTLNEALGKLAVEEIYECNTLLCC